MIVTNPNGANGTTSDPREQLMWNFYVAKLAKGIENAYESAIEAKYSEDHSRNITLQGWFKERVSKLKRNEMLSKAERNLDRTLDLVTLNKEGLEDPQLLKIKVDVSKTIVATLGKDEGYSTRSEVTGKDGKDLKITFDSVFQGK
jgi:coenzyme F420-reducing hydrogenase alpha subunit